MIGHGGEGLHAELGRELDRAADRAVRHLHQHDEAEAGAEAADQTGGGDQLAVRARGHGRHVRLLDQAEALALGQDLDALAHRRLAGILDGGVVLGLDIGEFALQPAEDLLVDRRRLDRGAEIVERLLDRRLVVGDELQARVDRRQLEIELRRRGRPPGRRGPGTTREARCSSTSLARPATWFSSIRMRGLLAVDRALLDEFVAQRVELLLLGAEIADLAERPVRSNTQTTVARWLRRSDSSRSSAISRSCSRIWRLRRSEAVGQRLDSWS